MCVRGGGGGGLEPTFTQKGTPQHPCGWWWWPEGYENPQTWLSVYGEVSCGGFPGSGGKGGKFWEVSIVDGGLGRE